MKKDWIEDGEIVYVRSGDKWRNLIDKYTLVLNYSYYSEYEYTWYSDDDVFLCWKHFNNFNEIFSVKIDLYCTTGVNIYSPMKYFNVYGLSKVRQVDREKKIPLVNYNTKNPHIVANNVSRTEMFFLTGGCALMKRRFLKFMIESLAKQQSKLDYINENIDDGNGFADAYISHCFNKNLPYNIKVHKGFINCEYDIYKTYCKLKGYDLNKKYNNNDFSVCRNLDNNVHIDIFHLNSIKQDNKTYYDLSSFGNSNTLITEKEKNEMEPFQKIEFEGHYFNVPNNAQHILCKKYNKSIGIEGKLKNGTYYIDKKSNDGFDKPNNVIKGALYVDDDLKIKEMS